MPDPFVDRLRLAGDGPCAGSGGPLERDEITVEAMRRAQLFVDVPASLRVFTERDIEARTSERLEDAFAAGVNTLMRS